MIEKDVIIVGGGPAGSSCAWRLMREGVDCLVLDRDAFPRHKLCGGWLTPEVLEDLELDPGDYPHGFLTFERLRIRLPGIGFSMATTQHSIRRYEFDAWLLERSGAPVVTHEVKTIRPEGDGYVIDGQYHCRYLVGAGGSRCPVYRQLFRQAHPRDDRLQVVAQELEFAYPWEDERCHLWFFEHGLPGYAWYVPKDNGYLNIGVGGMAGQLKRRNDHIKRHWTHLCDTLKKAQLVSDDIPAPGGYSYYVRDETDIGRRDNAFVIGDAAGLATRDLCEGIGAAVRSGLHAADTIVRGTPYSLENVRRYSGTNRWFRRGLEYLLTRKG
jgi:flavin-dependent dehydrogenase